MVTAVDVPDKNITLILDPTNPGIGVFKDGKIYMFSTIDGNGIEIKHIGEFVLEGYETVIDIIKDEIKSIFLPCEYSIEELRKMYGPEALNEALDYIKSLEEKETKKGNDFIPKAEINEQEVVENNGNSIEDTKKRRDREIY